MIMIMAMTIMILPILLAIYADFPNRGAIFAFVLINYGENLAFSHLVNSGDNNAKVRQMLHDISDLTTKL